MKINRKRVAWYLQNIRANNEELTDEELIDKLATWMEVNPECIDMDGVSHPGRYYYSTVGYGIFSLLGERYRMGRVEIFDKQNESGYQIAEGSYCMPFVSANQFEDLVAQVYMYCENTDPNGLYPSGDIDLVINTPVGRGTRQDGWAIRTASVQRSIPIITTTAGFSAAVEGIRFLQSNSLSIKSLQKWLG